MEAVNTAATLEVSKISNLCDPDPPTSQTGRQTDRRTDDMQSQYRAMHWCISQTPVCEIQKIAYMVWHDSVR